MPFDLQVLTDNPDHICMLPCMFFETDILSMCTLLMCSRLVPKIGNQVGNEDQWFSKVAGCYKVHTSVNIPLIRCFYCKWTVHCIEHFLMYVSLTVANGGSFAAVFTNMNHYMYLILKLVPAVCSVS